MRDATTAKANIPESNYISIHASYAGRDVAIFKSKNVVDISIHASYAGRDGNIEEKGHVEVKFQSTRPMRDATQRSASGTYAVF